MRRFPFAALVAGSAAGRLAPHDSIPPGEKVDGCDSKFWSFFSGD